MNGPPAILGGTPTFETPVYVVRPSLPPMQTVVDGLSWVFNARQLSNNGPCVQEFERRVCEALNVRNCVAMSNGTLTLILALKALNLSGDVIVPSFTFCATAHAVVWAGLRPVFADIDPRTFNITPETVEAALTPMTSAIMPVHVFGNPCDIAGLEALARKHGLGVIFDSAQAIGSTYGGRRLGTFGDLESFSVHATKLLPTGEGGLITTNDDVLADYLRCARNFGQTEYQDCLIPGINAKMAEFPAIMGIEGLKDLDKALANRRRAADAYQGYLSHIPGLRFQTISTEGTTNRQNLAVIVDEREFGLSRDQLTRALDAENIHGRKYFYPPVHRMTAYLHMGNGHRPHLPATDRVSDGVLCLPMYSDMTVTDVARVCMAVEGIHRDAVEVRRVLSTSPLDSEVLAVPNLAAA